MKLTILLLACSLSYAQVPNPTKDKIYIPQKVKGVYDTLCRKIEVKQDSVRGKYVIDLSDLPIGLYLVKTERKTFKVIKK